MSINLEEAWLKLYSFVSGLENSRVSLTSSSGAFGLGKLQGPEVLLNCLFRCIAWHHRKRTGLRNAGHSPWALDVTFLWKTTGRVSLPLFSVYAQLATLPALPCGHVRLLCLCISLSPGRLAGLQL